MTNSKPSQIHRPGATTSAVVCSDSESLADHARPVALICSCLIALAATFAFAAQAASAAPLFDPKTDFPTGAEPISVISGDFNGDGFPDLVLANQGAASVSILLGDGSGGFGPKTDFPTGTNPASVASDDFNGDGKPDLAVASSGSNTVSILFGDGIGGFGPKTDFSTGVGPISVTSADFDADGKPDLAVANYSSNTVSVLLNNGSGSFGPKADFPAGTRPTSVTTDDFNGDGIPDLAVANQLSDTVSVLFGDGIGGFLPKTDFPTGADPFSVISNDFNGDGKPDLAVANFNSNTVSVLLNNGSGGFPTKTDFPTGANPRWVTSNDFDGDGFPDLAVANRSSDSVSVLSGDGSGGFGPKADFAAGAGSRSVISDDFNGDGKPDLAVANVVDNTVSVLLNITPVMRADVKITKTATPPNPRPGDTVTYTLKAENIGTAVAENVVITDTLPVGVTFLSADTPCLESAGNISCEIGSLNPGDEQILEVKVTVDQWGTADPAYDHLTDVQRVEAQIDLEAGQQKTVSVSCPSGFFATDGSVRIDHIDQGTGDWDAPQVLESRATSTGTWQGTVKNTASGRAQAKIFAVCVRQTTSPNSHTHNLIVSDQIFVNHAAPAGKDEATLQCGPGQVAVQPGFSSTVPGDLLYSKPEGNGWKFKFDLKSAGNVTYSIRCLTRKVALTHGHTHDLKFKHIVKQFTIQPGKVHEAQLTCEDGYKGIVADMDLDHGLISLGNDPRPVTRAYKVYNPTGHPLEASFSLLCLGDRTGGEHAPPKVIENTASISTTSYESDTSNNTSTATITAEDTDSFTPVPNPPPVKPTPNNPIATTIVGKGVTYSGISVSAWINCSGACQGTAKLLTTGAVKVGGKKLKKGTVLATGRYRLAGADKRKLKLRVNTTGRTVLKRGGKVVLKLSSGKGTVVRIRR